MAAGGLTRAISLFILINSINVSVRNHSRELAGPTQLRIIGATTRGGLDQNVTDAVAKTDGVAAAIPMVQAITLVEDAHKHESPVLAFGI